MIVHPSVSNEEAKTLFPEHTVHKVLPVRTVMENVLIPLVSALPAHHTAQGRVNNGAHRKADHCNNICNGVMMYFSIEQPYSKCHWITWTALCPPNDNHYFKLGSPGIHGSTLEARCSEADSVPCSDAFVSWWSYGQPRLLPQIRKRGLRWAGNVLVRTGYRTKVRQWSVAYVRRFCAANRSTADQAYGLLEGYQ